MRKKIDDLVEITVIKQDKESALVEFAMDGFLQRRYVPVSTLAGQMPAEVLQQGIPYGYPWEDISVSFDSRSLAEALNIRGVWIVEDALKNPQKVQAALYSVISESLNKVLSIASEEKKRRK